MPFLLITEFSFSDDISNPDVFVLILQGLVFYGFQNGVKIPSYIETENVSN